MKQLLRLHNKPGNDQAVLVADAVGHLFTNPTVTNNCKLLASQVYDRDESGRHALR
ncbi:MAG: hypothetical protein ABI330_09095 [Caldimonas sp.]